MEGRDANYRLRSACTTTDGRDARYRFRRVGREDLAARWRGIAEVLLRTFPPRAGGDRSDRLDAVVSGADGRAGDRMPVGDPAKIRAAEPCKQKNDRRDAQLLLKLLVENRFPTIWMPSTEQRDLRALLRHRHQWGGLRFRYTHTLQSMALNHGLRRGHALWNQAGQHALWTLPLAPHASERRAALLTLYPRLQGSIEELDKEVCEEVQQHAQARRLLTHREW